VLYGDRRMTAVLAEYIGEEIIVNVENEYTWSWRRGDGDLQMEG